MKPTLTLDISLTNSRPTILKLGGSLLNVSDIAERLVGVVDACQISRPLVLVGGGSTADLVRKWDQIFRLSDSVSHDLAIQAMSLNSKLFAELHSRFERSDCLKVTAGKPSALDVDSLYEGVGSPLKNCVSGSTITVIEPVALLKQLESEVPESDWLPRSWQVTSDSIAAWLAVWLNAQRLVLLKSRSLPEATPPPNFHGGDASLAARRTMLEGLSKTEVVDLGFSNHASKLPHLSWCNLRDSGPEISANELVDLW